MANGRSGWGVSLCALALAKGAILSSERFDRPAAEFDAGGAPDPAEPDPAAAQPPEPSSRTRETSS